MSFDRAELREILDLYARKVAEGEWRDYALDFTAQKAVFSIFRRTSEFALYQIEKTPRLARKQGAYRGGRGNRSRPQARARAAPRPCRARQEAEARFGLSPVTSTFRASRAGYLTGSVPACKKPRAGGAFLLSVKGGTLLVPSAGQVEQRLEDVDEIQVEHQGSVHRFLRRHLVVVAARNTFP